MNNPLLPRSIYIFLFALLGIVYITGLFVPLMDNDSAHHANIALHMYLTGDYVSLVDYGRDYLDKPHLHFWLCAFSYKIFGVTTFAYKFPSFLFTVLGTYSTYRLGRSLYNNETGKLAALIVASAFAYMLANNDVRMDAILTACVALSTWQLVDLVQTKKLVNVFGAALGLALGFSTKGHIAVFVPAVSILFYILYRKEWKLFINPKCLLLLLFFGILISPVVYCYYLQYNLHPETMVRGKDHIDGVKFILLNQSVERFSGEMGSDAKNDYLFFIHSFAWAFAPWSILAFAAVISRTRNFFKRKQEWLTTGIFWTMLLVVSFSGFKLPHYLNIVFPAAAVLAASYIISFNEKQTRNAYTLQVIIVSALLLFSLLLNAWAFPVQQFWIIGIAVLLLATVFYFIRSSMYNRLQKTVGISVAAMIVAFFLLNTNFYPQLLTYQAGNELASKTKGKIDPQKVNFWNETYSSSFCFYTKTLRKSFADSVLKSNEKTWLLYDTRDEEAIRNEGYKLENPISSRDFEITKLNLKFVNPATREKSLTALAIAEISK
ncbi:MAG TPA: glycosyltransferase family 39 protein [Chitinophagaceae bacterium]|nr:glycosyltransferase family 39 protein [Chitinophagaceae bacterium]